MTVELLEGSFSVQHMERVDRDWPRRPASLGGEQAGTQEKGEGEATHGEMGSELRLTRLSISPVSRLYPPWL